jgi:hypothetical protein
MVSLELNDDQVNLLRALLAKKIKGTQWVLENKDPKNPEMLQRNIEIQQSILDMLPQEEKAEPAEEAKAEEKPE